MSSKQLFFVFWVLLATELLGYTAETAKLSQTTSLADELAGIQSQISILEQGLLSEENSRVQAKGQIKKIRKLLILQKKERDLGKKRLIELQKTVVALEARQKALYEKIDFQERGVRRYLTTIQKSYQEPVTEPFHFLDHERLEAPRRKVLGNRVDLGLQELEILRADLFDAHQLEIKIQEEKQQLAYLFQTLKEQESVLELNRQLQVDVLRKKQNEKMTQLKNYRKLKNAEAQVEALIKDFSARVELERSVEMEKGVSQAMIQSPFFKLKGHLCLPVVGGKILSAFGKSYDPLSGLTIFKKGIDVLAAGKEKVKAISVGKIAYSGEMPHYGKVVIIDHGDHFYSLYAHLGRTLKKTNEPVLKGEGIGLTSDSGTPLYFEIRARNVAVNPLQWVLN